jgi:signal transduction histidine kinase
MRPLDFAVSRLASLYLAVFAIGVGLLLSSVYLLASHELELETDRVIEAELEGLRDEYELEGLSGLMEGLSLRADSWGRLGAVYLLTDLKHQRVAGNLTDWPLAGKPAAKWVEFEILARTEDDSTIKHPVRAGIFELGSSYLLLVGTDLNQQRRFVHDFRNAILWGIGLTMLLAASIGYFYVRRIATRVRDVALACEQIISGDLGRRLPAADSGNEFDQLSHTVNLMLDRLEQQSHTLRATFDSTAHDLRAPLHRVRMRLEQALRHESAAGDSPDDSRAVMQSTLADVERVQRTLATLMQIAQADAGSSPLESDPIDLEGLARELVELYEPVGRAGALELRMGNCAPGLRVQGSRQLLAQLITNLIENALKYVPEGGHVSLAVERHGERVALVVADDGPGIPSVDRERVLRPFERLERDAELPGSGLGLSLAAAIARLHHGRLLLEDNLPGLRVVCELPMAAVITGAATVVAEPPPPVTPAVASVV